MAMNDRSENMARRARDLYRRASHDIDPAIAGRLRAARREAMAPTAHSATRRLLLPAGAFAVLALAALLIWPQSPRPHGAMAPTMAMATAGEADSDLPPDADSADPAMVEHLQFYAWLADDNSKAAQR
jgi:hypothetical protein